MQRILNRPSDYVDEMLEGIYAAYPDAVCKLDGDPRCYIRKDLKPGKVGIITGGGSGHLPLFLGYVGDGMLDGCGVGNVFQSPSSMQLYNLTRAVDQGAGVLYIYGNYGGDIMNFDMAKEMAEFDDIAVQQFVAGDDVASASRDEQEKRRGVAGIFYIYKVAGAAAEAMLPLEEVHRLAAKAAGNTRTMGVALSACIVPEIGKPSFAISDGEMEIGMGIHGESGIRKGQLKTADEIVDELMDTILPDLPYEEGCEVSVLVNGLGGTPKEELFIVYRRVAQILAEKKIRIYNNYIGEFATSMEMAGMSVSLMRLDDELKKYLAAPCGTPFFVQR